MQLPGTIELASPRLAIRPAGAHHLDALMAVNGDAEVTRFLPYDTWRSPQDATAWLERMQAMEAGGTGRQLVVERADTGQAVGTVLLFRFDAASQRAELGYVLGRAHWGSGLMHEALSLVLQHAFGTLGIRRIEAEVHPGNLASGRLLLRLGFRHEGRARKRWVAKGHAYDTDLYGMLADEWQSLDTRVPAGQVQPMPGV